MILNAMFSFQTKKQKEEQEKISKMTKEEQISYFLEKSKEQTAHTQKMIELSRRKSLVRQYYNSNDFINSAYEQLKNNQNENLTFIPSSISEQNKQLKKIKKYKYFISTNTLVVILKNNQQSRISIKGKKAIKIMKDLSLPYNERKITQIKKEYKNNVSDLRKQIKVKIKRICNIDIQDNFIFWNEKTKCYQITEKLEFIR